MSANQRRKAFEKNIQCKFERWIMKIINDNPYINWKSYELSQNPNITMDIIKDNPDKPWEWNWVSRNPNITWDIINENPDRPWRWKWLSMYLFTKDREIFFAKERRIYMARYKIKIWIQSKLLSPNYKKGRKHIERVMNELF